VSRAEPALQIEPMLGLLAEHGVEFVIIGGFALSAHGVVRGTKDIDIVPDPDPKNLGRLASALRALDAEVMLADDFDREELGLVPDERGLAMGRNWVLRTRLGRLDVMQDVPGIKGYRDLRDSAVVRHVAGAGDFQFAGLDDLIAMKAAVGRPQDEIDITSLERARGLREP
jgi:predicted nucleotidyltransferase